MASKQSFNRQQSNQTREHKINWSLENARHIREAKAVIQEEKPEEELKQLYKLKNVALDESLSLLASRQAQYRREDLHGIQTKEEGNVILRRMNRGILSLTTTIKQSLAGEEIVYNEVKEYLHQRYERKYAANPMFP